MGGILWSDTPYGLFTFVLLTLVLGGAGAWATGRAMAQTWRPMAMLAPYMLFLTAGVRFLHYALYGEPLLSVQLFITAYVWIPPGRGARLSGDARDADGDAIFLGLRKSGPELAREGRGIGGMTAEPTAAAVVFLR